MEELNIFTKNKVYPFLYYCSTWCFFWLFFHWQGAKSSTCVCMQHTDNHGMNANRSNLIFSFDDRSLFPSLVVCRNYGSINKFVVFARMHHHHSPSTFLSDSPLFYLSHLTSSSFHSPLYPRSCRHAFG